MKALNPPRPHRPWQSTGDNSSDKARRLLWIYWYRLSSHIWWGHIHNVWRSRGWRTGAQAASTHRSWPPCVPRRINVTRGSALLANDVPLGPPLLILLLPMDPRKVPRSRWGPLEPPRDACGSLGSPRGPKGPLGSTRWLRRSPRDPRGLQGY